MTKEEAVPVQPVETPILCSPYDEPNDHWLYDRDTGAAKRAGHRRPAGYWYKTDKVGAAQQRLFTLNEEWDELYMVNLLREDVRRWREAGYRGASSITRDLLKHWTRRDTLRPLFFCQREAVETLIWLAEIAIPGRWSRTQFQKFHLGPDDIKRLLQGERPAFDLSQEDVYPTLIDHPEDPSLLPLRRLGSKMATGSGKTVVMAMLIAWAFCNRARNPGSREFPSAALVCCPNLTVKERLQVLRTDMHPNYYEEFDIVPRKYHDLLKTGRVLVTNWHAFAPESEHREGDRSYAVVNKGPETPDAFAKRVLGELGDRLPIMVLNDEGHHCWRPAPVSKDELPADREEKKELEEEKYEATVWVQGLDRINNSLSSDKPGIAMTVDLSATPFYIQGSGHPEGRPFPWLVSDFGLVDAIESGIVKIPRLPVQDATGRPEPKYFKLWETIRDGLKPGEKLPGKAGKPKPEVVFREAEGALQQIAAQWRERFKYLEEATPGQEHVPPVLIVVCDNTDLAKVFYEKISGEREEEVVTEEDIEAVRDEEGGGTATKKKRKKKVKKTTRTVYEKSVIPGGYFENTPDVKHTIRIDSKLLAEAESEDPRKSRQDAAEALREVVATVGKPGQPGEHVRCVVSVSMLTEGWDANNVTQILGLRAFGSQLLCEQVVGRGLRRMDYTPDPETGLLTEEYVDVYGIPFSVIPFKGRATDRPQPEDRPKNHVRAVEERAESEIRFPVVEGYAFALKRNLIRCEIDVQDPLVLEPNREPTATFLMPTVGYQEGARAASGASWSFVEQNREAYYEQTHLQQIEFQIAKMILEHLLGHGDTSLSESKRKVFRLQSRHQLFPQVYRYVSEFIEKKVDFNGCHPCELGLERYVRPIVERLCDAIVPDDAEGEPPLLPVLNRHKPIGTTAEVDFKTVKPCFATQRSHLNQVVADTATWETSASFHIERCEAVECYVKNDHLGLAIPYEYQGIDHNYEPDFIVRLKDGRHVVLEIKGMEDEQDRAKYAAARRWATAVSNWGRLGNWVFHASRNPQKVGKELAGLLERPKIASQIA